MTDKPETDQLALPEEAGLEMFEWLKSVHLEPEVKRRISVGELAPGASIYLAQVLFRLDRQPEVRINDEVQGTMEATATRELKEGEAIGAADMSGVSGFVLPEADGDAAHITMVSTAGGISLYFDGAYNGMLIASHVDAADEFIETAQAALDDENLRAFVQNAFDATELLAKSEMLSLPEERLLGAVGHGTVHGFYNQWASLGNTEGRFAQLLNRLADLRGPARYLRSDFTLEREAAGELLVDLRDLRRHVEDIRPKRKLGDRRPRRVQVVAAREVRAGEVVGPGAFRIFK